MKEIKAGQRVTIILEAVEQNGCDFCVALTYLMSEKDSLNRFKVIGNKFDKKK